MGFVGGQTLEDRIGGQPLKLSDALKYAVQIADGLATAHAAGITHRDIEPGNIMVNEKELVKILSSPTRWAAKAMARQLPFVPAPKIVGTVAYMSPQQAEGKDVGAQSDIFRLARCSTRRSPDAGRSAAQAAWRLPC
jgi:serine/threonine-protein kinase